MTGIAQNGNKRLIFIVVPQVRTNMREKSRRGQKQKYMRRDKSKENTLIYISICIYAHTHGHTNIYTRRYTYAHIHIIYYLSRLHFLTLCLNVFKLFTLYKK